MNLSENTSFGPLLRAKQAAPGLALAALVAGLSVWLAGNTPLEHWGLGSLSLAILLGMLLGNSLCAPFMPRLAPGLAIAKKTLLQLGVALYGVRLMLQDVGAVGWLGVLLDVGMLASTFVLAVWLGTRWLGLERETAMLIGAGNAVCGAAAILATEPVVKGRSDQVSVAVACVVLFGTLSTFIYPWLFGLHMQHGWLAQGASGFGIYTGATVHEVAQVVAAASGMGEAAANAAIITKMVRVLLLAPLLMLLGTWLSRQNGGFATQTSRRISVPWFVTGFIALVLLRSVLPLSASVVQGMIAFDNALLAMAMAALGLGTLVRDVMRAGSKPLALAGILWIWLMAGGAAMQILLGHLLA